MWGAGFINSIKQGAKAQYRPWFEKKVLVKHIVVREWVKWAVAEGTSTPHGILEKIWAIISKRIDKELGEKLNNPAELKKNLMDIIKTDPNTNIKETESDISGLKDEGLADYAKLIYLQNYQIDLVKKYCLTITRKQIILKMEAIEILKQLDVKYVDKGQKKDKIFAQWKSTRAKELSAADNDYMNDLSKKYTHALMIDIADPTKRAQVDFFDTDFAVYAANQLCHDDFNLLSRQYKFNDNQAFKKHVDKVVSSTTNISYYWWYASLALLMSSGVLCTATLAGFFESSHDTLNPYLDTLWNVEAHDPVFRGAGIGCFLVAALLVLMLHPVKEKSVFKNPPT